MATAVDEQKEEGEEGKEEREQEGDTSSFIRMCLAWLQRRSPPNLLPAAGAGRLREIREGPPDDLYSGKEHCHCAAAALLRIGLECRII